jgi:hypothetical protein
MVDILGLLLLGGVVGIGGAMVAHERRARSNFITRVRTEWTRSGQIVRFGPVGAFYYDSKPQPYSFSQAYGALGITQNKLTFQGFRRRAVNVHLPFKAFRWIGVRTYPDAERHSVEALVIHSEDFNVWRVYAFTMDHVLEFADELSRHTDLPLHQIGREPEDYGPAHATRLIQDIYGEWSGNTRRELYLAPDRLLFGWEDPVMLSQVRQVGAFVKGSLNPFSADLLRIEYQSADGSLHTVGFLLHGADRWAEVIARRANVPLTIQAGRKKKDLEL